MKRYGKQFWRSIPFLRLLLPFIAGMLVAYYAEPRRGLLLVSSLVAVFLSVCFRYIPIAKKYTFRWVNGLLFNALMACAGAMIVFVQNIQHDPRWIGYHLQNSNGILVTIQEPLTEKPSTFKTIVKAESVLSGNSWLPVKGSLLVYFKKDSTLTRLRYGTKLIIQKNPGYISNPGNPGAFDYRRYCAFQGIYHQLYLLPKDYSVTGTADTNNLTGWLIRARVSVLSILKKYIPGEKESGVAEALLIGYRADLDKDLVRAYSNTGVVHIIAISGLHLGMIYGLLLLVLRPFRSQKWIRWCKPLLILVVLWGFSLLAGAAASILRSAVMFSFIVIGESLRRRTNIYNTLAASAFCLLVYDPYFLWDVGFQLSYAAVLSIVLFMKPIYKWFYFRNRILNAVWQLNSITLAAQLLTLPVLLYYFHQFPTLFLFTNFIAVPVSGFILYGELALLLVCRIPFLNSYTGQAVSWLVSQLNGVIERTDQLPYGIIGNIQVSLLQALLLYFAIAYAAWWLLHKKSSGLVTGMFFLFLFIFFGGLTAFRQGRQQKLIVYNVPKHTAIDVIKGNHSRFIGDLSRQAEATILPARILYGFQPNGIPAGMVIGGHLIMFRHKSVLLIDKTPVLSPLNPRITVDIIVLSGHPEISLSRLAAAFACRQYVFDSSNPLWKIRHWKKEADSLHLRHHSVPEQGAFEMDL
ncbi:MAG: ComEC/Rec2 family competence protein [Sediminibacterium sp.]|nr:ComEC/Rec2 family competence protein [Sediminibacterium sp.]